MNQFVAFLSLLIVSATVGSATPKDTLYWPSGKPVTTPIVVSCWTDVSKDPQPSDMVDRRNETTIALNEVLVVKVYKLQDYLASVGNQAQIALVLNNVVLKGIRAFSVDRWRGEVRFQLSLDDFNEENGKNWAMVIGSPRGFQRKVTMSVADVATGKSLYSLVSMSRTLSDNHIQMANYGADSYLLNLIIIREGRFWGALITGAVLIGVFLWLCFSTAVLRVSRPMSEKGKIHNSPYSLALVQMAFWYIIVIASTIFLWVITGVYVPLPTSVLGIIGVSTITSLSAKAIDQYTKKRDEKGMDSAEKAKYENVPSRGFFKDLIYDGSDTASLPRMQILLWTVMFGFYFLFDVYRTITIPAIDESMLVLMGLTSSAYVGSKFSEPRMTKNPVPVKSEEAEVKSEEAEVKSEK